VPGRPGAAREALVRLLPRAFSMKLETWVTMHEDLRHSPRCRAAFDALAEGLQQYIGAAEAPDAGRKWPAQEHEHPNDRSYRPERFLRLPTPSTPTASPRRSPASGATASGPPA
jgi:hypothetical protein